MSERRRSPVLVVSQLPPPFHGSTVMTAHLIAALRDNGHDVAVVQRRFSATADVVGRPSARKVLAIPALVLRLAGAAARIRPVVCVFFLTNRPGSFLVDSVLLAVLRGLRVPILLYVHTSGYRSLAAHGPLWDALVRIALSSGPAVTLGDSLIDDIDRFTTGRIETVPNMTAPPADPAAGPRDRSEPHLVFLSNLDPEKGAETFVQVAARLRPGWRFTIAGAGTPDRLTAVRETARTLGVDAPVVGALDTPRKWALLQDADVLLFPSTYRYEAQPLTIVEAMSLGVPVVAYDVGGIRDVVDDGVTGRVVDAGDVEALARAVDDLRDADARATLGRQAQQRFERHHSPAAYRAAWAELVP